MNVYQDSRLAVVNWFYFILNILKFLSFYLIALFVRACFVSPAALAEPIPAGENAPSG